MDTSSFASRRPAATALPAFSLPSPSPGHEIPRVTCDGLSPSPGVPTGSSQSSQAGYYPSSMPETQWQSARSSAAYTYTTSSAASPNPALTSLAHQSSYGGGGGPGRSSMLQPSMSYMAARSSQQQPLSASAEALPPPPPPPPSFQHHPDVQTVSSFQNALSSTGPSHHHHPSSAPPPQLQNPTSTLSSQSPVTQAPTPASSTSAGGDFRPPPTPGAYSTYPTSSTPSQPNFPSYAPQPSPTHPHHHPSTTTSGGLSRGLASISAGPPLSGMAAPQMGYGGPPPGPRPPASGYPYHHHLPGVAAPVMSNIGNPGGQMALVSGVSGMSLPPGFGPHGHHPMMFGHSHQPSQERPFKCDTCPQSFNRNHDLKRHKRIHLAVKPFPCTFCEKSFSRKDALKRHRLVKGCGGGNTSGGEAEPSSGGHDGDLKLENKHSPRVPKQEQEQ